MFKKLLNFNGSSYKIIDDDFEEEKSPYTISWLSIIEVYSKRNLPVVPNLIRFMLWYRDYYGWSLDRQVIINKKHNPRWHEVEQDLKKYLLFS